MMEFGDFLIKRRSIRDFDCKEVPLEIIEQIITESCLAPSSGNTQPWRFIIIKNKDVIKRLSDESKNNLVAELEKTPKSPNRNYEMALRDPNFNVFYNAPCLVFIVGPKDAISLNENCALAACYFMFSALDKGLGTCWIGLGKFVNNPELLRLIGIPDDCQIVAPIIVGYSKNVPPPPERLSPRILKVVS